MAPTRKQIVAMTISLGLMCVAFGFSVGSLPDHPITTLRIVSLSCGGLGVLMIGMATVLQTLKAR